MKTKTQTQTPIKCRGCGNMTSDVTDSQLKRSNPRCRSCMKVSNSKNNPKNNSKTKENRHSETIKDILRHVPKFNRLKPISPDYSTWDCFKSRFINETDLEKLNLRLETTFFESPMGTSKTSGIIHYINQALSQNKSVVYVTPNLVTIQETSKRLRSEGINYCLHTNYEKFGNNKVVLSTVEGFNKHKLDRYDVVILDEAKSIFDDIGFKSIEQYINDSKFGVYNKIKDHSCVISFDSDTTGLEHIFSPFRKIKNLYRKSKDIRIHSGNYDAFVREIKYQIVQNPESSVSVQIDNTRMLKSIMNNLIDKGFITKDETEIWTAKDNNNLNNFDSVKYKFSSPKLARGVSITSDIVFIKDDGKANPFTIYQMVDRARDSKLVYLMLSKETDTRDHDLIINRYIAENRIDHGLYKYSVYNKNLDRKRYITSLLAKTYNLVIHKDGTCLSDKKHIETEMIKQAIKEFKFKIQGINFEDLYVDMYKRENEKVQNIMIESLIQDSNFDIINRL